MQIFNAHRGLYIAIALVIVFKLIVAAILPINADEAYLYLWGKYPSMGYYDHPPMAGWLLIPFTYLINSPVFIRLIPIAVSCIIVLLAYRVFESFGKLQATGIALILLLSPPMMLMIGYSIEVPLALFVSLSVYCFYRAETDKGMFWYYPLSGLFLGLGFITKYSALVLMLVYIVYFVARMDIRKSPGRLLVLILPVPFIVFNLYWNYLNGYPHQVFDLFTSGFLELNGNITEFALLQIYLMTPVVIYAIFINGDFKSIKGNPLLFMYVFFIPLVSYLAASIVLDLNAYTMFPYYAAFFIIYGYVCHRGFVRMKWFVLIFSLLPLIVLTASHLFLSDETKRGLLAESYSLYRLSNYDSQLQSLINIQGSDSVMAAYSYADAAVMEYNYGKRVSVLYGTENYRQDDFLTDFKTLDGKTFYIIQVTRADPENITPFFDNVTVEPVSTASGRYFITIGEGFKYLKYRNTVLKNSVEKHYNASDFLPTGGKTIFDKYDL